MEINTTKTVKDLALEIPGATRVFEKLGIDYCCGGEKMLHDACANAGVSVEEVLNRLKQTKQEPMDSETADWLKEPLSRLTLYIVEKHHSFTKQELSRLEALLVKVCQAHKVKHPELLQIQYVFQQLKNELIPHMLKEEQILFPYIARLEETFNQNRPLQSPPFGTVLNPIRVMMMEHDGAGDMLFEIRQLSTNFTVPPDGCISYKTLYQALEEFEKDLHQHIHLENNILFPRAAELEGQR